MALASAAGALLKPQTPLQQLLEDINFQRTKEMRQLLKDDGGFVVLQGTTYWTDLFVRHFLFQSEPVHSIDSDDLLFFVRKKHVKSSSRHMPKYETEVEVFRKDSRKLPIGDPDVDWEETVYLNMVIHQFDYTLTLAICTRTSPKELQVLRRHSQRVYASPSRRKMDTKGDNEEITYPHICFMVDNFDEVFSDILVRDGEMVCVELVANDKDGAVQGVIFLGSIRYDALKKVYDARQSSLSSKVAQRMSFGLFSSGAGVQTRCEFVRMKGPQGKGHAEMAVTKPKGSGVETPTSEPGYCATDMWDEWEEENDDYCTYRHQRRLSDPSANLNNFTRYSWRTKNAQDAAGASAGTKARSENEGLDSLASEVSEIEAGDLRDDPRPAFSASVAKLHQNPNCDNHKHLASNEQTSVGECKDGVGKCPLPDATAIADAIEVTVDDDGAKQKSSRKESCASGNGSTTGCGNCFGSSKKCKRWVTAGSNSTDTPEMSEVYCPSCDDTANATPACLSKMPDKRARVKYKTILSVESELVVSKRGSLRLPEKKAQQITRSASLSAADRRHGKRLQERPIVIRSERDAKSKLKASKEKNLEEAKAKDKDCDKKSAKSVGSSILAKVSPKRIRAKTIDKIGGSNKKGEKPIKNNNTTSATAAGAVTVDDGVAAKCLPPEEYELADDATSLNGCELSTDAGENNAKIAVLSESECKLMISVRGKEELPAVGAHTPPKSAEAQLMTSTTNPYRFEKCSLVPVKSESHPLQLSDLCAGSDKTTTTKATNDNKQAPALAINAANVAKLSGDCNGNHDPNDNDEALPSTTSVTPSPAPTPTTAKATITNATAPIPIAAAPATVNGHDATKVCEDAVAGMAITLPRSATRAASQSAAAYQAFHNKALTLVPKRRTPDGTNIYYWCDLHKRAFKELDDGAYNPLWASRGFTQSFHFWKENRRQQSIPLNAFLTYVTLPWWSIAKDLLDHRETPILTF